jgi:gamma-glutamylcyclotransferase (GGCT)/AIG2-like uncharacterized protein YtfP
MVAHMHGSGSRYVFVYGTLRRGAANDINRLQPVPRFLGTAYIHGTMYDLGAYPGVLLGGERTVLGEVYEISPTLEQQLDAIEEVYPQQTGEYLRREVPVSLAGRELSCLVYEINPLQVHAKPVVAGGDWVRKDDRQA